MDSNKIKKFGDPSYPDNFGKRGVFSKVFLSDMTSEGLGEMFEGEFLQTHALKNFRSCRWVAKQSEDPYRREQKFSLLSVSQSLLGFLL